MDFDLSSEQQMWREAIHDFAAKEVRSRARETDEQAKFNWEAVRKMGPLGLLGLNVPEAYGGPGVDAVSAAIAIEELGWACGSTALAIAAAFACSWGWQRGGAARFAMSALLVAGVWDGVAQWIWAMTTYARMVR